jgi:Spy/CpxP family protein refolding chaperone
MEIRPIRNGLGVVALSFGLLAWPAGALPPRAPAPPSPPDGHRIELMLEMVDATDAQRAQIGAIRDSYQDRIDALQDEGADLRAELEDLQEGLAPVDIATIRPVAARVGELMAEGIILQAQLKSEIASVLTDAQLAKVARLQALQPETPRPDRAPRRRH